MSLSRKDKNDTWTEDEIKKMLKSKEKEKSRSKDKDRDEKKERSKRDEERIREEDYEEKKQRKHRSERKDDKENDDDYEERKKKKHHKSEKNRNEEQDEDNEERRRRKKQERKERELEEKRDAEDRDQDRDKEHEREERRRRKEEESRSKSDKYDDEDEERRRRKKQERRERERGEERENKDKNDDSRRRHKSDRNKGEDEDEEKRRRRKEKEKNNDEEYKRRKERNDDDISRKKESSTRESKSYEDEKPVKSEKRKESRDETPQTAEEKQYENEDYEFDFDDENEANNSNNDSSEELKTASRASTSAENPKQSSQQSYRYQDEEREERKEKVIRANKPIFIPTDDIKVYSTAINYNNESMERQRRRAKDLLEMIELDKKTFKLFDLNPDDMNSTYGANYKHVKIQTNEEKDEAEIQTDDIECVNKWTQYPAEDSKGSGGDKNNYNYYADPLSKFQVDIDTQRMYKFLNKSGKLVLSILNKNQTKENKEFTANNPSKLEFAKACAPVQLPEFMKKYKKIAVTNCEFCQSETETFVVSFHVEHKGILNTIFIIWDIEDIKNPKKFLILDGISTSCCFYSNLVLSGNQDGSVTLWDTRESENMHKVNEFNKSKEYVLRSPTYNTAGVLKYENHPSEVKCIKVLHTDSSSKEGNLFVQIASLDLNGKLIIWTVVELSDSDTAASEIDLGLIPGGKIKLVKGSEINVNQIARTQIGRLEYQTLSFSSPPNDTNNFYVSTDIGQIVHVSRDGGLCTPSSLKSQFTDGVLEIKCLSFHHEMPEIILAGYGNGEMRLYHTSYRDPINRWFFACGTNSIEKIEWLKCKYSSALVFDSSNKLYIWDFLVDDTKPIFMSKSYAETTISCVTLSTKSLNEDKESGSERNENLVICSAENSIEIHNLRKESSQKQKKEKKYFERLIRGYVENY